MKTIKKIFLGIIVSFSTFTALADTPFIGEMRYFAGNFAPRGWAFCEGQLLPITQNTALFSILGTMYGGDGRTNFALPDMRGKALAHAGNGPGLTPRAQGSEFGQDSTTMTTAQMPTHNHSIMVSEQAANNEDPDGNTLASARIYRDRAPNASLDSATIGNSGASTPIDTKQPYLGIRCIIALQGVFPSRS